MAESTATLRQEIKALSGIDIMLDKNNFKSTYQIMDELSAKWEDLTDIQRASITELLAGKHQGNIMSALMTNFDTARAALDTSLNSSGSAMAEHEKWSKSLEAQLLRLKAAWQSLSQSFLQSDSLKVALDAVIGLVNGLDKLISTFGTLPSILGAVSVGFSLFNNKGLFTFDKNAKSIQLFGNNLLGLKDKYNQLQTAISRYNSLSTKSASFQEKYNKSMANSSSHLGKYLSGLNGAKASFGGYVSSLVGATIKTVALEVATTALNAALTMGISALISFAIKVIDELIETEEELAERVDELTSKFKEQHNELTKGKSSFKSEANRYSQLSKGVDQLGRNVSLTTDEYSEYQSVVNKIAEQIPSLITGYDSQGNAILNVKGNVDELVKAYEALIEAENRAVLSKAGDVKNDFKNVIDDAKSNRDGLTKNKISYDAAKVYEDILNGRLSLSEIDDGYINDGVRNNSALLSYYDIDGMVQALENAGLEMKTGDWWNPFDNELTNDFVKRAFKENKDVVLRVLNEFYADLEAETEGMKSLAQAAISNAFDLSDSNFYGMNDTLKNVARQAVNSFDYEFFAKLTSEGKSVESYVNDMLAQLNKISGKDVNSVEAAFNLRTQFNNGDISYGEFVHGIENAGELIDKLDLSDDIKSNLKLSLGLNEDDLVEEYETLINRLTEKNKDKISKGNIIGLGVEEAEKFIDSLSAEELSVVTDVIPELDANATVKQIQAAIDREILLQGLAIDLNIEVETAGLDALNTALSESKSATGLTAESISALKARYEDLDGYNVATLFEETANGIRLNSSELSKLESEYKKLNKQDLDETLEKLVNEYDNLTSEINNCKDASKRADLYAQRDSIIDQINDTATLASQYEGLTSAYKEWQRAQEAGQDRDQYESIISGRKEIEEEMYRGWLDDATVEYLELLSGKDLTTAGIDAQIDAYKELDKAINGTDYSIWDFFTEDDDGNATSDGVFNFFEAVKDVAGETAAYVKDGKYNFDFEGFEYEGKTGDAAIAAILGTSEELVQIMLKAAEDAGFVVNIKGDYTELANLKNEAEVANDKMKELGATTYTFNFDSTDVKDLNEQIAEAEKMLVNLKNEDGTLKVGVKEGDYRQAQDMIAALVYQKQSLDDSAILHVDTSQAKSDIEIAISKLQEFRQYTNTIELQTAIGADTSEATTNIQSVLTYIDGLNPEIKAGLGLDTEEVQTAIGNVQANIQAGVAIKQEDLDIINSTISSISNDMMVELGLDTTLIDNYKETEQTAKGVVNWENNIEKVTTWINQSHEASGTVNWDNNTENVKTTFFGNGIITWSVSEANGTANVNGTASGRAFKQGSWGINGSGTALGGELGTEILVRDGRWYTIGDTGAEFFNYKKGDIIFNHKQTEELFANGKVTSGGGRGKSFAHGSAFAIGSSGVGNSRGFIQASVRDAVKEAFKEESKKNSKSSKDGSTASGTDKDAIKDALPNDYKPKDKYGDKEFKESFDWIEIAISRVERVIDNLDKTVNNVYKSWSDRNSALSKEIGKVRDEINLQEAAAQRYLKEANSVGLDASYAQMVRDGAIDIDKFEGEGDEKLVEKIKDYQKWYELYLQCTDAAEDLRETEAKLYQQRFEHVQEEYDGILQGFEHTESMLNEYIAQSEAKGYIVSKGYYDALIKNEENNISTLKQEQAALIAARNEAEAAGIDKNSQAWRDMCADIDSVTQEIEAGTTSIAEYGKAIRDIDWEVFDLAQERISNVASEADFLIELMSNKKLFDDNGQLTDNGLATMGLHAQNHNTYMYLADEYGAEIAKLDKEIAADPYNQDLINRRQELVEAQRESILSAENEKDAIKDLVEEGINLELDALQERIDLHNEELESMKDLYDYQKRVKEQTEEIASLEKQMAAYSGDNSEEAKAKIQELKVSLDEAKSNLEETEFDHYISQQQSLLDTLYTDYETILNTRLDNVDALLSSIVSEVNGGASTIKSTLEAETGKVGTMLSTEMNNIWGDAGKAKAIVTTYGEDFKTKSTTTNTTLGNIKVGIDDMMRVLGIKDNANTNANKTSPSSQKDPTAKTESTKPQQTTPPASSAIKVGGKINAGNAKIYDYAGDKSGETQYFKKDPIYKVLDEKNGYLKVLWHKLSSGVTGWFKKSDVKALATGAKRIDVNDMAWTQEKGQEYIVRPSDGAILTPVAKGDSVLNATASNNIWNMANSPTEFIRDNLKLNATSLPNNSNVQSNYTQHLDKVVFNFPNVKNYDDMLSAMQKDRNFEKLVLSMTIDQIAGKSSLSKGKSIR
jgi:hypothetical protein